MRKPPEGLPREIREITKKPELTFYFSAHHHPKDFEQMRREFEEADIYISEQHGWTQDDLETIRAISAGTQTPAHLRKGQTAQTAGETEDELLYNSHKPVCFVDLPEGHELEKADDGQEDLSRATGEFENNDFEDAIHSTQTAAEKAADFLEQKDQWIAENIKREIPKILEEHPEFRNKNQIKILVQMGASHLPIRRLVADSFQTRRAGEKDFSFGFYDELIRHKRFSKETPEALPPRALLEIYLKKAFDQEIQAIPHQEFVHALRKQFSALTTDHIHQISVNVAHDLLSDPSAYNDQATLKKAMKAVADIDLDTFFDDLVSRHRSET